MIKLIDILNEVTLPAPKFPLPFKSGGVNLTGEAAWNKWRRWADINRKDKYIDDVLNTIKRNNYQTTQRQLDVLVRWFSGVRESLLEAKKKRDRCLRIADRRYKTPSAYKSGAAERCRQGDIWKDIKEDLNNNHNQDSIKQVFKDTPELSAIGTVEQYTKYLETIFPNSKVKDILYHSSPNKFEKFRESMFGTYFSYQPMVGTYGDNIYSVIVNVKNPLNKPKPTDNVEIKKTYDKESRNYNNPTFFSPEGIGTYKYDASIERSSVTNDGTQIKIRTPEQIHILGSKQDIEGFKKYVDKTITEELIREKTKETLRTWFKRQGPKGKEGGWIDCNAPDGKGGYKACGRKKGEKRAKYPACKATAAQCKAPGKGKTWGKKSK